MSAAPGNFGLLPASARRRVLVAGSLAGLLTAVIALSTITGIEAAIGQTLSCLGRDCQQETTASDGTSRTRARTSLGSVVGTAPGGSGDSNPQVAPAGGDNPQTPNGEVDPNAQPSADNDGSQPLPQDEIPTGGEEAPQAPAPPATPAPAAPQQPGVEIPATPGDDGVVTPTPVDPQQPPTVEPSPTPPPVEEEPAAEPAPTPDGAEPAAPDDAGASGQ